MDKLMQDALEMQQELTTCRRALHQIPELGLKLPQTVLFVKSKLEEMGISCQVYEDCSCITAVIGHGERCFLLRSDMDALPMTEESDVSFAAQNGCMHSCGHDMHTSILLGAAKLLKSRENELGGTVKLLFQSGEEIFAGAAAAIEAGVLESPKVNAAFSMHVAAALTNNVIIYGPQPMAAVYGFRVTLTGKGTHGSTPHLGIDPINTAVHIYLALQELAAREVPASEEATLTIGRFDGGTASNIIPERVVLEGTLRTFNPELQKKLISRIHSMIKSIAETYRTGSEIEVLSDVPAVCCPPDLIEEYKTSIHSLDPDVKLLPLYHVMGSEDFALISEQIPSGYFCIGAGMEDKSVWIGQHNPKIVFNEKCLPLGAAVYTKVAMDWLENHKEKNYE